MLSEGQFFGIDQGMVTDVAVRAWFVTPCTAGSADVAILGIGIEIDGVGEPSKETDLIPFVIIMITTARLFKTEALFFAVVETDGE